MQSLLDEQKVYRVGFLKSRFEGREARWKSNFGSKMRK